MKKIIFEFATRLSFGASAKYFKVEKRGTTLFITEGTPQSPKKSHKVRNVPTDVIDQISNLSNDMSNSNYIEGNILANYEGDIWK